MLIRVLFVPAAHTKDPGRAAAYAEAWLYGVASLADTVRLADPPTPAQLVFPQLFETDAQTFDDFERQFGLVFDAFSEDFELEPSDAILQGLDKVVAFTRDFLEAEIALVRARAPGAATMDELSALTQAVARFFEPGLFEPFSRNENPAIGPSGEVIAEPRPLFRVRALEHPLFGRIHCAYLGSTFGGESGITAYRYALFIRETPEGPKVFSVYDTDAFNERTGLFDGSLWWCWSGGEEMWSVGCVEGTKKLQRPTRDAHAKDYDRPR